MNNQLTFLKNIRKEIQISVIATDVVLTLYVLHLIITNTAHWLPGVLLGYTPIGVWLLLRANKLFHLCLTHRLMLIHSFMVYGCCVYQAYYGFGIYLYPIRWLMFLTGIYLVIKLIIQQIRLRWK